MENPTRSSNLSFELSKSDDVNLDLWNHLQNGDVSQSISIIEDNSPPSPDSKAGENLSTSKLGIMLNYMQNKLLDLTAEDEDIANEVRSISRGRYHGASNSNSDDRSVASTIDSIDNSTIMSTPTKPSGGRIIRPTPSTEVKPIGPAPNGNSKIRSKSPLTTNVRKSMDLVDDDSASVTSTNSKRSISSQRSSMSSKSNYSTASKTTLDRKHSSNAITKPIPTTSVKSPLTASTSKPLQRSPSASSLTRSPSSNSIVKPPSTNTTSPNQTNLVRSSSSNNLSKTLSRSNSNHNLSSASKPVPTVRSTTPTQTPSKGTSNSTTNNRPISPSSTRVGSSTSRLSNSITTSLSGAKTIGSLTVQTPLKTKDSGIKATPNLTQSRSTTPTSTMSKSRLSTGSSVSLTATTTVKPVLKTPAATASSSNTTSISTPSKRSTSATPSSRASNSSISQTPVSSSIKTEVRKSTIKTPSQILATSNPAPEAKILRPSQVKEARRLSINSNASTDSTTHSKSSQSATSPSLKKSHTMQHIPSPGSKHTSPSSTTSSELKKNSSFRSPSPSGPSVRSSTLTSPTAASVSHQWDVSNRKISFNDPHLNSFFDLDSVPYSNFMDHSTGRSTSIDRVLSASIGRLNSSSIDYQVIDGALSLSLDSPAQTPSSQHHQSNPLIIKLHPSSRLIRTPGVSVYMPQLTHSTPKAIQIMYSATAYVTKGDKSSHDD